MSVCGCASDEALQVLIEQLSATDYANDPVAEAFRLLFDLLDWREHGISARADWATEGTARVIEALRKQQGDE